MKKKTQRTKKIVSITSNNTISKMPLSDYICSLFGATEITKDDKEFGYLLETPIPTNYSFNNYDESEYEND